jgi:hypothetical protein
VFAQLGSWDFATGPGAARWAFAPSCANKAAPRSGESSWTSFAASTLAPNPQRDHRASAAALRYQHVMAGRDAAIAAALDELIQAASTRSQDPAAAGSGTRLARTSRSGRKGSGNDRPAWP